MILVVRRFWQFVLLDLVCCLYLFDGMVLVCKSRLVMCDASIMEEGCSIFDCKLLFGYASIERCIKV
jgi:hypothetical protein